MYSRRVLRDTIYHVFVIAFNSEKNIRQFFVSFVLVAYCEQWMNGIAERAVIFDPREGVLGRKCSAAVADELSLYGVLYDLFIDRCDAAVRDRQENDIIGTYEFLNCFKYRRACKLCCFAR